MYKAWSLQFCEVNAISIVKRNNPPLLIFCCTLGMKQGWLYIWIRTLYWQHWNCSVAQTVCYDNISSFYLLSNWAWCIRFSICMHCISFCSLNTCMVDIITVCTAAMLSAGVHIQCHWTYCSVCKQAFRWSLHWICWPPSSCASAGLTVAVATPCDVYDQTES